MQDPWQTDAIRGQGSHVYWPTGLKNTNLVEDISISTFSLISSLKCVQLFEERLKILHQSETMSVILLYQSAWKTQIR